MKSRHSELAHVARSAMSSLASDLHLFSYLAVAGSFLVLVHVYNSDNQAPCYGKACFQITTSLQLADGVNFDQRE